MDGANADSDHSMTWEDFFGSTTDLTPTLIGIYDSFLNPTKTTREPTSRFDLSPKDARNDPPQKPIPPERKNKGKPTEDNKSNPDATEKSETKNPPKDPSKIAGSVKLPGLATMNKSALYSVKTKLKSENDGEELAKCNLSSSDTSILVTKKTSQLRTFKDKVPDVTNFDNLSPNVKRMISSASETNKSNGTKFQKKSITLVRSSVRGNKLSNIPLVGATSKISQSGVEILPSVEIYDQPSAIKATKQSLEVNDPRPKATVVTDFKVEEEVTYDVPTNNKLAIYDIPNTNKTAFECLSLPYIDQSIDVSASANDREFDVKLSSKDNSPDKPVKSSSPEGTPSKIPKTVQTNGTNSLHRKDFTGKNESPIRINPYPDSTASTGNLKLCDKERLQAASMEVPRPLSMSSIASSSSTSSSGVQNKGGVNSAYLASIESLDDHSDADITSAAGSSNFVNDAGALSRSISEEKHTDNIREYNTELPGLTQLERVCAEIVQTENVYVDDLRQVVEGYLEVWRQDDQLSQEELTELFNNIEDIYAFNKSLCSELNTCQLDAACIARCFVLNTDGFGVYTSYCTGYPGTMARLAQLAADAHSSRLLRDRQTALGHRLPLASYLLKPVQRILKYHLLLQKVVKLKSCRDTEAALRQMTAIAHHIDDMKRRHEHAVRVQEIQSLLYGWTGPDLTTYGELCAEGTFRVFGAKAMRHAFLFDKMLLITKNREDGILAYKSHIMCNNMMLVECIAGAPLSFHVIPWDTPRSQLTLQARSQRHKREWTLLLKRVILENYNAVIPSHARQLVMELGQNKTDDDILAEKSHNLITQASMRKQLSAPEYLEKRKLERDRRKSFDSGARDRVKKVNRKHTIATSTPDRYRVSCDCVQYSAEKGIDYTCENCYIDLCSDCELETSKKEKENCLCKNEGDAKCPECDRALHYIDAGSAEHLERKPPVCKCSDFKSSQESVGKEFSGDLNRTRGYHSSDNIAGYAEGGKEKEDLSDTNSSCTNVKNIHKTCLKCDKIKENIAVTDSSSTLHSRKSRCTEVEKLKTESVRSKSKDDPQRSKLSKIGTWRRKSEPGLQQNSYIAKRSLDSDHERSIDMKGYEKIEFECRQCGSNKITRKTRNTENFVISDSELESRRRINPNLKQNFEIKMYNSKHVPKKISKIKKNRAKGLRLGPDTTAKFYADFSTDVSTENILHISESNDSINAIDKGKEESTSSNDQVVVTITKDEDMDEETYKRLLEKTDSFKKNELEKVKYLNQQKVINEVSEVEAEKYKEVEIRDSEKEHAVESCDEVEQPLEQIISQLLMQNREFQKLLKKQQLRNSAQRRHQRLLKSYSNPDYVVTKSVDQITSKPKFGRQTSENLEKTRHEEKRTLSPQKEVNDGDDEHIYETLRVESPFQNASANLEDHHISSTKASDVHATEENKTEPTKIIRGDVFGDRKIKAIESDYVYLSFEKLSECKETEIDVIYDVPQKVKERIKNPSTSQADYYVTVEKQTSQRNDEKDPENVYDSIVEVRKRQKQVQDPGEYQSMSSDQSPNTPEIWLSRQKEHFNVSRDRKSGSLPRSFQVVIPSQEVNSLSTFKCKPNGSSKTYLNKDGKVVSMDRPFTIASDKSELSYDDVENYMSDGDLLKFSKNNTNANNSQEADDVQNISQSTLELEDEIDRCYKSNFENISLDPNKSDNLTASHSNLNTSITSSCEMLTPEISSDLQGKDINVIHPEHKIYKPTSNILSLKSVLSRFKNKSNNKNNTDDSETNSNEKHNSDTMKTDLKSPTSQEKRFLMNPRNYSRNLLQRFRSIISDEQSDDNQSRAESSNANVKNEIKVVVTTNDGSPTISTIVYSINSEASSRSVYENTTLTHSQTEKNNLETFSNSCHNLVQRPESSFRPSFEKSVSTVSGGGSTTSSPSKSNNSSYQSLNKLPIYMQGSKHLGARIAQSDYVDPTTIVADVKYGYNNVNVFINKNSIRPDSLFSNSSFVTSSSEGAYTNDNQSKNNQINEMQRKQLKYSDSTLANSDDSYYEKSFERIEQIRDDDVFRDSAVYSDQEDGIEAKATNYEVGQVSKDQRSVRTESATRQSSFKSERNSSNSTEVPNVKSFIAVSTCRTRVNDKSYTKSKIAPPVPMKPKIVTQIPINANKTLQQIRNSGSTKVTSAIKTTEGNIVDTDAIEPASVTKIEYNTDIIVEDSATGKTNSDKSEDTVTDSKIETNQRNTDTDETENRTTSQTSNIHLKRMSFERSSLDSAARKTKSHSDPRRTSEVPILVTKSVLERRMEIESMSKTQSTKPIHRSQIVKPKAVPRIDRPKLEDPGMAADANVPVNGVNQNEKGSWVKQVVNKFQ